MRKKVLVVGPSPTKSKGGIATVIEEIENDDKLNGQFDIEGFDSYVDGNKVQVLCYSLFAFLKFVLTKKDYDLYHIHAASRGSTFRKSWYIHLLKKWRKKVILHIHGAQYLEFFNEISNQKKSKVIDMLKSADMVIALSNDWKKKFEQTFGLMNCYVLENGIDQERLSAAVNNDVRECQKAFVALGRLGERKGTYDIIEAVKHLKERIPDIKCYLAGDGEIEKVKTHVKQDGLEKNIEVIGWADFDRKLSLLKRVSTVLLPSYNEGLPMSVLEGMACGKAIISTTVGAIPEVVGEDNGILITAGDVDALAAAMERCCTDVEMMRRFHQQNIKKIKEEFSTTHMHRVLAEYYDSLLLKE